MSALREEALKIVNEMPEDLLSALLQNLQTFKYEKIDSRNRAPTADGFDPKKLAAFKAMEDWRKRNKAILDSITDWDKEREMAMEEKYGSFN